jgi:RNA polymerase sigma-70 factor (ECF subfamily)
VDSVKAWAFRVYHNLAMNHLKKNPRDVHEYGRTNGDGRSGSGDQMVAVEPDPERRLLEKERYQRLGQSIGQLTEHQKRCLYLRAEGFRYREIAEQLNITISSVVDTLTRAVERLRKA